MDKAKPYSIVVELPREYQAKLRNEKAKRQLANKEQSLIQIASELLAQKIEEVQPGA